MIKLSPWVTTDEHCPLGSQARHVILERKTNFYCFKYIEFGCCLLSHHSLTYPDSTLQLSIKRALKLEVTIPVQTAQYRRRDTWKTAENEPELFVSQTDQHPLLSEEEMK